MNVTRTTKSNYVKYITLPSGEFFYYKGELFLKINDNRSFNFSKDAFNFCFCDDTKVVKVNREDISITFSV